MGFAIGDSPLQAVRVVVRWAAGGMPDADEACPSWGEFNDIDDLIFTVAAGPEGRKLGVPAASIRGATAKMAQPLAFPGVAAALVTKRDAVMPRLAVSGRGTTACKVLRRVSEYVNVRSPTMGMGMLKGDCNILQ